MNNPYQFRLLIIVQALIILIGVSKAQVYAACMLHSGESDSLITNAVTGNGATDSTVVVSKTQNTLTKKINPLYPQVTQSDSLNYGYVPKWYSFITNLPGDMVDFYRLDFTSKNIPVGIGIGTLTAGLLLTDNQTWKASDKIYKKGGFVKSASNLFVRAGDGTSQFGLAVAFGLYGAVFNDSRALRTASEVVEAVLASGAVVQVLKHITGRESPYVSTKSGGAWRFFPNQIQYAKHVPAFDAYPSGHLTTSLAAFTVIAENYPEAKWITPVTYTTEALLAISMVNTGIHWYSDYPLAVFLGYEFGKIIAHHGDSLFDSKNDDKNPHLVIAPYFDQTDEGLSLSFVF